MYSLVKGDIFLSTDDAIVNPVNTVGVDGAGLALAFKKRYPNNSYAYREACRNGTLQIGEVFIFDLGMFGNPRYIINFPTKQSWYNPSQMSFIEQGLCSMHERVTDLGVSSIGVPLLGAGLGGLRDKDVVSAIINEFEDDADITAKIYCF